MSDFKNLRVWQEAHQFTVATILASAKIRGSVGILVRNQLVRAAMSVPANIAEGSAKRSDREFARFARIALGSATEAENHLILARALNLIDQKKFADLESQVQSVQRMLSGLEDKLTRDASSKRPVKTPRS